MRCGVLAYSGVSCVEGGLRQSGAIADHYELPAGPGHGDIHPADLGQKADPAVRIAAGHPDIDDIPFLALEAVDGIDGDLMWRAAPELRVFCGVSSCSSCT